MKRVLAILLVLALAAGIIGYRMYNKPHRDLAKTEAEARLSAAALLAEFVSDEAAANKKYLDKVVEVSGTVREITQSDNGGFSVRLDAGDEMAGVVCELAPSYNNARLAIEEGAEATLRGSCTGFLLDVVLARCVIVQ